MIQGKRLLIAWLVASVLHGLPAIALGQSAAQPASQSAIFPSLAAKEKKADVVWPEPDVVQGSPIRQTVFQEPDPLPAAINAPQPAAEAYQPPIESGGGSCPQCRQPLDHPILESCDSCGPCRRLLCLLSPGNLFAGRSGAPVYREPWISRPFSAGVFVGPIVGSSLLDDWVGQQTGTLAGARFGLDIDDDCGVEMRLATANVPLYDSEAAIIAQRNSNPQSYLARGTRNADHFLWDIDFLYYPWGDSSLRPYLLFGLGTYRIQFNDRLDTTYARVLLGMPVGLGMKMHLSEWMIFRVEFTDNMAFAGSSVFQSQHNFSATGALEVRLGRSRIQYWPWNPGR